MKALTDEERRSFESLVDLAEEVYETTAHSTEGEMRQLHEKVTTIRNSFDGSPGRYLVADCLAMALDYTINEYVEWIAGGEYTPGSPCQLWRRYARQWYLEACVLIAGLSGGNFKVHYHDETAAKVGKDRAA